MTCDTTPTAPTKRPDRRIIRGEHLRAVAMPLGGIGTGTISLAGDGGWRQWEIHNIPNHLGYVPHSFFAVRMRPEAVHFSKRRRPEDVMAKARILMSPALYDDAEFVPPVTSSDHMVPDEAKRLLASFPGVAEIEYVGEYPIAEVTYRDPDLPLPVRLEAYSPFAPLNEDLSGIPCIICVLSVTNTLASKVHVSLAATLQNAVGWDGRGRIMGVHFSGYGGNANRVIRSDDLTTIEMTNGRLPRDHERWGQMALSALHGDATYLGRWDAVETFWADYLSRGDLSNTDDPTPSAPGSTVNGALSQSTWLEPGKTFDATFALSWFFPNHHVNWDQQGFGLKDRKSKFFIGTHYASRFSGAFDVARYVRGNFDALSEATHRWRDTFYDSTLPYRFLDAVSSQTSIIRSPTCIWLEDDTFHAFEGCHGASTGSPEDTGGCCPMNCTHVWNYEQALARLFPRLERSMRRTDLRQQLGADGRVGFRTLLPLYLEPRFMPICADGQSGTVLKTYREYRVSGDRAFLDEFWPGAKKAMEFIFGHWDPDADGIMEGQQHNTYDIDLHGRSSFTSSLYLAALRAAEEMARIVGDHDFAAECRKRFDIGTKKLDADLWNGEYYVQKPEPGKDLRWQYVTGCHIDQIMGQWWAHILDLGYVLPKEHVRTALRAVLKYNWRDNFCGFEQKPRIYCSDDDKGLLMCTWPKGGRPEQPTLYSDEAWPGTEYEIAGQLLFEGMPDEAFRVVEATRARYDGRQRNPWNEVECGDHYARSLASWTLLEAASGYRYDASKDLIAFGPKVTPGDFRAPFVSAEGWGTFEQRIDGMNATCTLSLAHGTLGVATLELDFPSSPTGVMSVTLGDAPLTYSSKLSDERVTITFAQPVVLVVGQALVIAAMV